MPQRPRRARKLVSGPWTRSRASRRTTAGGRTRRTSERRRRLAAAMRANLRRRKEQQRGRARRRPASKARSRLRKRERSRTRAATRGRERSCAMAIMPDRWIREMALAHGMIEPFVDRQTREGVISYGLSSYGYDARVAPEFRIFTNVDNALVDPKNFSDQSFVERSGEFCVIPPNSFVLGAHGRVFPHPARHAGDLPRQEHLCPLRHDRERDPARARVGGPRHARDLQHHARCRPGSTPTRASASSCSCKGDERARGLVCRPQGQIYAADRA